MVEMKKRMLLLLSGGFDSFTYGAFLAKKYDIYALTFDFNQRSRKKEIEMAQKQAEVLKVKLHRVVDFSKGFTILKKPRGPGAPGFTLQNRDLIFLTCASMFASPNGRCIHNIAYGATATDFARYPDCRPSFIQAAERAINEGIGVKNYYKIHAPVLHGWTKKDLVALKLVPPELSWSCKDGKEQHCGKCRSCRERQEVGLPL
jgi:7-cyano-7-deazaguanine synthase